MKKIIIALAAVAAALLTVACNKELEDNGNLSSGDNRTVIYALTESALTKTALSGNDTDGYKVVWSEGDRIMIRGNEYVLEDGAGTTGGSFAGPEIKEDDNYYAWYAMTDKVNWTLPATQTYSSDNIANAPMCASFMVRDGVAEPVEFKNICGLLRLTLKNDNSEKLRSITISADENMAGAFSITGDAAYIVYNGVNAVTLDCGEEGVMLTPEGKDFYIALPQKNYNGVKMVFTYTSGASLTKTFKSGKTLDITRAQITPAAITVNCLPKDAVQGIFSVSESRKVAFSKGNLKYDKSADKWGFYDQQYDFEKRYTGNSISLFTWGYNESKSIIPDGTDGDNVSRTSGDLLQSEDWGSLIGDGSTWRTLTKDEWDYLLKHHTYKWIKVLNTEGAAIFPKNFNGTIKDEYSSLKELDEAGVVFLPAAGYREGSTLIENQSFGDYWTSTAKNGTESYYACLLHSIGKVESYQRSRGLSVRLVTDIN